MGRVFRVSWTLVVLLVMSGLGSSTRALGQAGRVMAPSLPFDVKAPREVPFLDLATRDPMVARSMPRDEIAARQVAQEIRQLKAELGMAKGAKRAALAQQAALAGAGLSYFLEDAAAGRVVGGAEALGEFESLVSVRRGVGMAAGIWADESKVDTFRARYLRAMARWQAGDNRVAAAGELAGMKNGPAALVARARFAAGVASLPGGGGGRGMTRAEAMAAVARGARDFGGESSIAAWLVMGRADAARRDKKYRAHLGAAARLASRLESAERGAVAGMVLALWRQAEGANPDWRAFPLSVAFVAGVDADGAASFGLRERVALSEWAAGRLDQAIAQLTRLSADLEGRPGMASIDLRVLDMRRAVYVKSRQPGPYEKALDETARRYASDGALGVGNEARAAETLRVVLQRQREFVDGEIALARAKRADSGLRGRVIKLLLRYTGGLEEGAQRERYMIALAELYASNQQYAESVTVYQELSEKASDPARKRKFMWLAVDVQRIPASWPAGVPWGGVPSPGKGASKSVPAQRDALLALYAKLDELDGGAVDWAVVGHMGWLQNAARRDAETVTLWTAALTSTPKGVGAGPAAGWLLRYHRSAEEWAALEAIARLALKHAVTPVVGTTRVSAREMLGLALLNGGKRAVKDQQWGYAIKKLEEYTRDFAEASTHDEGMYFLAQAYRGGSRHSDAVKTHLAFVEKHPSSRLMKPVLLEGFQWCQPMAWEENAMFFGRRYLRDYGATPDSKRVREDLFDLYMGRTLYGDAATITREALDARHYSAEEKIALAASLMDLEARYGVPERAQAAATRLLGMSGVGDDLRASAFLTRARYLFDGGRLADLRMIEEKLRGLDSLSLVVGNARSQTSFLVAELVAAPIMGEGKLFSIGERDPLATLNKRYASFSIARDQYARACVGAGATWCAPAWFQTARVAERLASRLEDLTIAGSLDKAVVDGFERRKKTILGELDDVVNESDMKALSQLSAGNVSPDWSRRILWQNAGDWLLERPSNDAGRAYVQFGIEKE